MILSGQTIRKAKILEPFAERTKANGTTFGLGPAGYDLRLVLGKGFEVKGEEGERHQNLYPGDFILAATLERFTMPRDVVGVVHDKSSWARRGITVQNTVIEPGWCGFLTLEIKNISRETIRLQEGQGIAQVIFHRTDEPVEKPYKGKYQDQEFGPQVARS